MGYLEEVAEETYQAHKIETEMLFEFIDNWIDLIPGKMPKEEGFRQIINSLSGVILLNSWKTTNLITYEILVGKYFEAIRNLRFLFEGTAYSVIFEDAIEARVFQKWGTLSELSLKSEILRLFDECRNRAYRKKKGKYVKLQIGKIYKIVREFVNQNIDSSKKNEAENYVTVYTSILSDKRLYIPMDGKLRACKNILGFNNQDLEGLKKLWHELSEYQHFSYHYLDSLIDDPDFCFVEKANGELFKLSLAFYLKTLDFFYAVLAWRFSNLRKSLEEMNNWWKTNFNIEYHLLSKILTRE